MQLGAVRRRSERDLSSGSSVIACGRRPFPSRPPARSSVSPATAAALNERDLALLPNPLSGIARARRRPRRATPRSRRLAASHPGAGADRRRPSRRTARGTLCPLAESRGLRTGPRTDRSRRRAGRVIATEAVMSRRMPGTRSTGSAYAGQRTVKLKEGQSLFRLSGPRRPRGCLVPGFDFDLADDQAVAQRDYGVLDRAAAVAEIARDHERGAVAGRHLVADREPNWDQRRRRAGTRGWLPYPRITTGARGGASGVYSIHSASSA